MFSLLSLFNNLFKPIPKRIRQILLRGFKITLEKSKKEIKKNYFPIKKQKKI